MENWNAFSIVDQSTFENQGSKFWQFIGMGFSKVIETKPEATPSGSMKIVNITLNCVPLSGSIQLRLVDKEKHKDPEFLKLEKLYYEAWGFYKDSHKKCSWYRVGFAHTNKDQPIRVDLNAIPGNLKIQLRETEKKQKSP